LTESVLKETDVLVWWGHVAHGDVKDEIVKRVQQQAEVCVALGSYSKIFKALMGTNCSLKCASDAGTSAARDTRLLRLGD